MTLKLEGPIEVRLSHDDVARIIQDAIVQTYGPMEGMEVGAVLPGADKGDNDFLIVTLTKPRAQAA